MGEDGGTTAVTESKYSRLEHWLFDRPYSIVTFLCFGLAARLACAVWEPLLFAPLVVLLGLLAYFTFNASKT